MDDSEHLRAEGSIVIGGDRYWWRSLGDATGYRGMDVGPIDVLRVCSDDCRFDIAVRLRSAGGIENARELHAGPIVVLGDGFPGIGLPVPKGARIRVRPRIAGLRGDVVTDDAVRRLVEWCLSPSFRPVRCDVHQGFQERPQDDYSIGAPKCWRQAAPSTVDSSAVVSIQDAPAYVALGGANREAIYQRVIDTADRYGPGDPQQLKLFGDLLAQCAPAETLAGLLLVFERSVVGSANYPKQELAGRLLAMIKPKAGLSIGPTLRAVLPAYDPSIEQLPQYLAQVVGRDAVLAELRTIEAEEVASRTSAAARTMRWWLGDLQSAET